MVAERLIVVDVGSPLTPRDELDDLVSIVGQMTSLLTRNNVEIQLATLAEDDFLIRPELIGGTSADFGNASNAIDMGYQAADELSTNLQKFSVSAEEYRAYRLRIESHAKPSNIVQFVRLPKIRFGSVDFHLYRQDFRLPYLNRQDSRMIPNTHEGDVVRRLDSKFNFIVGHISKMKSRDSEQFIPMAEVAGVEDDHTGTHIAGVLYQLNPPF